MKEIVRINLDNEMDLIMAHKRTMKLAELCGLANSAQTRFATAVSEIARCSIIHGADSTLYLEIHPISGGKKEIRAVITDSIDLEACNPDAFAYASRLSRDIQKVQSNEIYSIILNLQIPYSGILSETKIQSFIDFFKRETALSPYEEIRKKNIQLIELSEKLTDSETKYRQLTDTLNLIIFSVSPSGTITLGNKQFKEVFGNNFESFSMSSIRTVFHHQDAESISTAWDAVRKRGRAYKGEARVKIQNNYTWHLISIIPESTEDGNLPGWIISMVDIQAQKLIEETLKDNRELREAQENLKSSNEELSRKNRELEQFAYIASHDLQEPLRKIRNFTSLAERTLTEEEKDQLYFNKINSSAERMSNLITGVLNYSKLSNRNDQYEMTDMNTILQEVIDDFEFKIQEKGARISVSRLPIIYGIPVQLGQLFYNLLGNSLKFVSDIPSVSISYEPLRAPAGTENAAFHHKITVADNGIGIEEKYVAKIFTIFKRLHHHNEYEGTGIGLALCAKIVENHKGKIEVHSIPDSGTKFAVYFP